VTEQKTPTKHQQSDRPVEHQAPVEHPDERPVYVVIPAAGSGSRMGAGRNKQFLEVGGLPLIVRTLMAFEQYPKISGYVVVTSREDAEAMAILIQRFDLRKLIALADGGATRQDSVLSGLRKIVDLRKDAGQSIALVHDGARCFVSGEIISSCIDAIQNSKHGGCGVAVPVKDTIKVVDTDGRIEQTLDRSRLWAMQTPQGADFPVLLAAYEQLEASGQQVTDDLAVLEAVGQPTFLVTGEYTNIKMTTPEDLVIGEALVITR
jgi:2-C-methyl-D-erythritol 4-phosphate cytidylyltransferase